MKHPSTTKLEITKVSNSEQEHTEDLLAIEEPLEISLKLPGEGPFPKIKNISITMRTPGSDSDLALGFLFTEGIIYSPDQIDGIELEKNKVIIKPVENSEIDLSKIERHFYTSSSCGVCGKASIDSIRTECKLELSDVELSIDKSLIHHFPNKLRETQSVFQLTGGIHAAALFDSKGELLSLREDVGRHNALDKLIGASFIAGELPLRNHILLLSGRASFELIQKAAMAGIQMVLAVGAPSSLAVELAKEFNMTLVGFLNSSRFNIYSGNSRLK